MPRLLSAWERGRVGSARPQSQSRLASMRNRVQPLASSANDNVAVHVPYSHCTVVVGLRPLVAAAYTLVQSGGGAVV
jgi:hypothetical protein